MVPQAGGGGGMSRAAKKRAKKKQKQQSTSSFPKHNDDANEMENVVVVPKKQLFDDNDDNDNDHDQPLRKISTKKKNKKRKSKMEDNVEEEKDRNKSTTKKKTKKSSHKKMKELLVHNDEHESDRDRDNVEMEMDGQMDSDDNHENDNVSPTRAKGELQKENDDNDDDDDDDDDDDIDQVVQDMVSMLSPSTILMLKNNNAADADPHDATILNMAKEQLSGIDLCQDVLPDMSSKIRATCLLNSLLSPAQLTSEEFYKTYWEKQPLVIPASSSSNEQAEEGTITHRHLHGFLSLRSIQTLLDKEPMCYGRDLNVTRYEDTTGDGTKRRITLDLVKDNDTNHNDGGGGDDDDDNFVLCDSKDVWSNYHDMGATIRLLCPHKHVDSVHALLSTLELEFGCMVGANAYLTPPGESQGFAPHYDDIEAFVLQLEGSKHWKVYAPLSKGETLPRQSSTDYTEEQLKDVEPTVDVVLKPGDILYMPRGWIHQAMTLPSSSSPPKQEEEGHSLHLTVSAMQNWAWSDLLELLLPEALEATCQSTTSTSLRQGLPRNFLEYMGAIHETTSSNEDLPEGLKQAAEAHGDEEDEEDEEDKEERHAKQRKLQQQEQFREEAKKRIMRVCKEAMSMIDAGCDQIGKRFLSDRLPPALFTKNELSFTSESKDNAAALATGGKVWPNTMCRLVRPGIARLALEDNKAVLYHCVDNSRVYHGNPLSPMEFELDDAPALEMLLTTVEPHWIAVQDLIHDDIEDKMDIAQSLYDEGILAIVQMETPDRSVQTG